MPVTRREWLALPLFVAIVAAVAVAASLATINAASAYGELLGPAWAPPSWLFGPVWTVLYGCIAVAGWMAWRMGGWRDPAMAAFWTQLVLNGAWSPLFFALQWRGAALVCIVALDIVVAVLVALLWGRSRPAALLLVPYLVWILFATALNYSYWDLNR